MKRTLKIFECMEFGRIRVIMVDHEPWFAERDVALSLGYKNPKQAVAENVMKEDCSVQEVDNLSLKTINESGLYSLIFGMKTEHANRFKRWITSDVLPSIRKYEQQFISVNETDLEEEDVIEAEYSIVSENPVTQTENNIQIFENEEFGKVRTVTINEEPWFVGKDVADILGYRNGSRDINRHVDEFDRQKTMVFDGNQNKETILINESGLYALIFGSKMKSAKRFKHWVTSEVLPSIRKHGGYIAGQESMSDEELLSRALLMAQSKIEERDQIIQKQDRQIQVMKPKAEFHDAVTASDDAISFGIFAGLLCKEYGLNIGRNRLLRFCRRKGYLCSTRRLDNKPSQYMLDRGYMLYEEGVHKEHGKWKLHCTPLLTGKGQVWLAKQVLKEYDY